MPQNKIGPTECSYIYEDFFQKWSFWLLLLSGRSILFLILVCPFDGWIQTMLIIAYFTQQLWHANPVRLLTVIYGDSHFCTQIMVDQIHVFSQVWGRASEIPHSKREVGHWQVAHYCTTISCAPASSDLSCFFKPLIHSSCYGPHPHTSPTQLHQPLPSLHPGCRLLHSLTDHVNRIQCPLCQGECYFVSLLLPLSRPLQSLVFVCLICPARIHLFIHFFTHPSIHLSVIY